MSYSIADIEVTQPLPTLSVDEGETGLAVLLRRKGKPVGFWMEEISPQTVLTPDDLSAWISDEEDETLLAESIREELESPVEPDRLPSLSIAICTKDRPEHLSRCLDSLKALPSSVFGRPVSVEILVVDNAPSDRQTQELVASHPEVRYTREPRPGLNFARNRALQEARGELMAFLDDDVTVDPGWLGGLMEAWADNKDAAAFTGLVLPAELETKAQILFERRGGFRRGFERTRYHGQERPGNPLYPCGAGIFGAGANMAFRRDVLLELGGFDEALDTGPPLPGGGDLDIFYRVIRAGYPLVYEPQYLAFHRHRRELEGLRGQYRSWGLGFMAFVAKSYRADPEQRSKFRWLIGWWFKDQLRQLLKSLLGRHVLSPTMILAELWGGIVGLCGEYARSSNRVEQIRHRYPASDPPPDRSDPAHSPTGTSLPSEAEEEDPKATDRPELEKTAEPH